MPTDRLPRPSSQREGEARLARTQSFDGIECKGEGERLWLYPDGKLMLGIMTQEVWIKTGKGYYVEGREGTEVLLHSNGGVRYAELAWVHAFKDIVLPCGSFVWLDKMGKPEAVELTSPTLIRGRSYRSGTVLDLRTMKVLRVQR